MATSQKGNGQLDLFNLLRSCECACYIDEATLTRLVLDADDVEICPGTAFDPWDDATPSLVFVLDGEVRVSLADADIRSESPFAPTNSYSPPSEPFRAFSKILTRGACLNSTYQLLSILSRQATDVNSESASIRPTFGRARAVYQAATYVKLSKMRLGESDKSVPNDVCSPLIQALMRKLYSVTFRLAASHFGLRDQVLACDSRFNQTLDRSNALDIWNNPHLFAASLLQDHQRHHSQPQVPFDSLPAILVNEKPDSNGPILLTNDTEQNISLLRPSQSSTLMSNFGRNRSSPNLKLQTSQDPLKMSTGKKANHVVYSPSVLSRTERKEKRFSVLRPKEPGIGVVKREAADALLRMLTSTRPASLFSQLPDDNLSMSPTVVSEVVSNIKVLSFDEGAYVAHQGERYPGICLILDGGLAASAPNAGQDSPSNPKAIPYSFAIEPGSVIGYGSLVMNKRSLFDFKAAKPTTIAVAPRAFLQRLVDLCPEILVVMAGRMCQSLPPLISMVDFVLDWSVLDAGAEVYKKGEQSDSIFFVIKGRIRTHEEIPSIEDTRIREFGPGDSFGVLEFHTNQPRPSSARAVRKSEMVKLQKLSYQTLVNYTPALAFSLWSNIVVATPKTCEQPPPPNRFRTIAILPLSIQAPAEKFASLLTSALVNLGIYSEHEVVSVGANGTIDAIGNSVFTNAGRTQLEDYLAHLEENTSLSILVGEHSAGSTWNSVCISAADCILFLAMEDDNPKVTAAEEAVEFCGTLAQRILVLLDDTEEELQPLPVTRSWIKKRPWLSNCVTSHIERARLSTLLSCRDFERLARRISGRSIAVVFGGGGARGFAHLGVLQALEEEGIPFDIIGGTSMGAYIGAIYAGHMSLKRTYETAKSFSRRSRWWKYLADLTAPILSWTTGSYFTNSIAATMDTTLDSSDLRLAFFCNATNMSHGGRAQTLYPQTRSVWQLVRASMGIPPIFPPFVIEGDSREGDLLVDGCFSANVPVFPALALGAEIVLAFDVSGTAPSPPRQTVAQSVSGWHLMAQRLFSCCAKRKLDIESPSMVVGADGDTLDSMQMLELLTFSTNINELAAIQNTPQCLYMMHDLGNIGAFSMGMFEDATRAGYENAKRWLRDLKAAGKLAHLALPKDNGGRTYSLDDVHIND